MGCSNGADTGLTPAMFVVGVVVGMSIIGLVWLSWSRDHDFVPLTVLVDRGLAHYDKYGKYVADWRSDLPDSERAR